MKLNLRFIKKNIILIICVVIVLCILLKKCKDNFENFDDYDDIEEMIDPKPSTGSDGHYNEGMMRHGYGSSVASSAIKHTGQCCQRHGCMSCNSQFPEQKKYGCKQWVDCTKLKEVVSEPQGSCTGCGTDKKTVLSTQQTEWW